MKCSIVASQSSVLQCFFLGSHSPLSPLIILPLFFSHSWLNDSYFFKLLGPTATQICSSHLTYLRFVQFLLSQPNWFFTSITETESFVNILLITVSLFWLLWYFWAQYKRGERIGEIGWDIHGSWVKSNYTLLYKRLDGSFYLLILGDANFLATYSSLLQVKTLCSLSLTYSYNRKWTTKDVTTLALFLQGSVSL